MAGHHHHHAGNISEGRLKLALALTLGFVAAEAFFAVRSNSLALLSDAGHNFTDALALMLSWYAIWIARKPATSGKTYGYHRVGILTALFNAVTLLGIAVFIFAEAFQLFLHPAHVDSLPMIVTAAFAVLINTVIAVWLHGASHNSLNMRGAFLHMLGDALSAAGVVVAGILIRLTGWAYIDPIVSVLIGIFIVYSSWGMVSETIHVLLEGTPRGLDMPKLVASMVSVPGVEGVHDLHVWTIGDGVNALSCHLRIAESESARSTHIVQALKSMLAMDYQMTHSTIETECAGCHTNALYCQLDAQAHSGCEHVH